MERYIGIKNLSGTGYGSNELVMEHATMLVTLLCNLKCKLCSAYAPYYTNEKHPAPDVLEESLKRFFSIVAYVEKFTICGGEPFIYPHLEKVLCFFEKYMDRIKVLEILTNGTIVPSDVQLERMQNFKRDSFQILIDNYGPQKSKNIAEIDDVLTKANISHTIRNYTEVDPHCGGWVDFGDLTIKKHLSQKQIEEVYAKCAYPQKLGFSFAIGPDGLMFPCGPSRRCKALGVAEDRKEYVDLFDDTLSLEEQRQKIRAVLDGKSLKACAYCNGLCEDSPRFIPAEQLS